MSGHCKVLQIQRDNQMNKKQVLEDSDYCQIKQWQHVQHMWNNNNNLHVVCINKQDQVKNDRKSLSDVLQISGVKFQNKMHWSYYFNIQDSLMLELYVVCLSSNLSIHAFSHYFNFSFTSLRWLLFWYSTLTVVWIKTCRQVDLLKLLVLTDD